MTDMDVLETGFGALGRRWKDARPAFAVMLGSGWSEVVDSFDLLDAVDYSDIPGMGAPGVAGHAGRIALARMDAAELLIFQGRRHYYEGVGWNPIAMPIYIAKRMGVELCLLTNAAGGAADGMEAGDLMVIDDHINMLGANPLIGDHNPFWGPRFPDQSSVYDRLFGDRLFAAGERVGAKMHRGIYLATAGPTFETPAEIRAFQALGADAVGMSTVPEAIMAGAAGMRVAGLSFITNLAAGISESPLSHEEVIAISEREMPRLCRFFEVLFEGGES